MGMSVILSKYGIQHECVAFTDKSELNSDNCPCIVILNGEFTIVESFTPDVVKLYVSNRGIDKIPLQEFYNEWNGTAILVYPSPKSGEPEYHEHIKSIRIKRLKTWALTLCLATGILIGIFTNPLHGNWIWWVLLILNIAGVGVGFLLLQKQLHIKNRLADKLCGLAKESHCEDVTDSDGGNLFGIFKLSEIGSCYFFINSVCLLFFLNTLFWLAFVAVTVLPFSFWSIWYQKVKIKSWCVLCLCTLSLMWIQAIFYAFSDAFDSFDNNLIPLAGLALAYITSTIILNLLMKRLESEKIGQQWKRIYTELKYNPNIITAVEGNASIFNTNDEVCTSLKFGNPEATNQITILSNPYCNPCARMHERIKNMPGKSLCINYVMVYFQHKGNLINRYIIAAYQQLGAERTWSLMTEWYNRGRKLEEKFFDSLNLDPFSHEVELELKKHQNWTYDDRLSGTPTIFVNGRELIYPYNIEDYMFIPPT